MGLTETFVYYFLQKTREIVFFRLRIYHNNRNKSINFIVMWNQANKKYIYIDAAGNSDAGGDDKLNFFFMWPKQVVVRKKI